MFSKSDFSEEQCGSLKMILGSKHVGSILNVLYKQFYVCALVGVLIKYLYEMHGATINLPAIIEVTSIKCRSR